MYTPTSVLYNTPLDRYSPVWRKKGVRKVYRYKMVDVSAETRRWGNILFTYEDMYLKETDTYSYIGMFLPL